MSIFRQIRESCERVALDPQWVTVDASEAILYLDRLSLDTTDLGHSPLEHLLGEGDDTLRFFVLLDCVNFGSGYFPYLQKDEGASGYFTIAKRLKDFVIERGFPHPGELVDINAARCAHIFGQDAGNPHAGELMRLFAVALNSLGEWVLSAHAGDYLGFLKSSKSADGAVRALTEMPFFRDQSVYFGEPVLFLKRAQILLQDMKLADPGHSLLAFEDFDQLTVFADNVLPYVFRADGLLKCDPWIESRIADEQLIAAGSSEEIELRACSVYIGELITALVREHRSDFSTRELDFILWKRGQSLKKVSSLKRHRTRCVYY